MRATAFLLVLSMSLFVVDRACAQPLCYGLEGPVLCCSYASPGLPCVPCAQAPGGCCGSWPVTDPVVNIRAPGTWHTNPGAFPPVVPSPTCTYRAGVCTANDPPCQLAANTTPTTCPDAATNAGWARYCPHYD